jgi:hypothetical protein
VVRRYRTRFPSEQTESLEALISSGEADRWAIIRNTLTHRASPGRHFSTDSPNAAWLDENLSARFIRLRREWLAESIRGLLVPAAAFVQEQVE